MPDEKKRDPVEERLTRRGWSAISQDFDYYEANFEGIDVASWSPSAEPGGPVTQVHVLLPFNAGPRAGKMVLRIKSKTACDALIRSLQEHRANVWGVI